MPDEQEPQKITIPPGTEGPEIPLEVQLAALQASMGIMAASHARALGSVMQELSAEREERDHYRQLWAEAADKLERIEDSKIKPLVILELEDNEVANWVRDSPSLYIEIDYGKERADARFVAILRPGAIDDG